MPSLSDVSKNYKIIELNMTGLERSQFTGCCKLEVVAINLFIKNWFV